MFESIEFIQINLQHSKLAVSQLSIKLKNFKNYVVLIQEPYSKGEDIHGFSSKVSNCYSSKVQRPRTCILTSCNIEARPLYHLCNQDLTVIRVCAKLGPQYDNFLVASAYLPYDSATPPPNGELAELIRRSVATNIPLIIGCDANAHHTVWGSTNINKRGKSLFEYLITTNLEILNEGTEPTFVNSIRQEVIDITMVSNSIAGYVNGWTVDHDDPMSDHRYIRFNLKVDEAVKPRKYLNFRKLNKTMFSNILGDNLEAPSNVLTDIMDLELEVTKLNSALVIAAEKSCPLKIVTEMKTPWWNNEIQGLRNKSRRLYRKAVRTKNPLNWQAYRVCQRNYKYAIKDAKQKSWQNFCESIKNCNQTARLHKLLTKARPNRLGVFKLQDGTFTETDDASLTHLLQVHFPGSEVTPITQANVRSVRGNPADWQLVCKIIEETRVNWAISTFDPYKSAGPDGISPVQLQTGLNIVRPNLMQIFRYSLMRGYIPHSWQQSKVVFIPKPGKNDYTNAKSFRPISLTSFVSKTMEKLIDRYIRETSLKRYPIHANQHAYQQNKGTLSAIHALVSVIETALSQGKYVLGTFVDIQGAFDSARFESILGALKDHGVPKIISRWINALLKTRSVTAELGISIKKIFARCGCPQGGVLSPLLWTLVINSLLKAFDGKNIYIQAYSDDVVILVLGISLQEVCRRMQTALRILENWCNAHHLGVSPTKTSLVLFTRKRQIRGFINPRIYGTMLELTDTVKYLGVLLDSKLNWKRHIEVKLNKAISALMICRKVAGTKWGLVPKMICWMYKAIVLPAFSYASIVWWHKTKLISYQKWLNKLQRLACLCITGAMRSTPTVAMEILLGLPPLHLLIQKEAMSTFYQLRNSNEWSMHQDTTGHSKIKQKCFEVAPLLAMPSDVLTKQYDFVHSFTLEIPSRINYQVHPITPDDIVCYTDGSRIVLNDETSAGAGINIVGHVQQYSSLGQHSTVFQAETCAIIHCCRYLLHQDISNRNIRIYSDSKSVILALNAYTFKSKIVYECKQLLNELSKENQITIIWVPGHSGIAGNEQADILAKLGASRKLLGPEPAIGISKANCLLQLNKWVKVQHEQSWAATNTCRQTKMFLPRVNNQWQKEMWKLSRAKLRSTTHIITGHCTLNRHLAIIGSRQSPVCENCQMADETAFHYLCECEYHAQTRAKIFGDGIITLRNLPYLRIGSILSFLHDTNYL